MILALPRPAWALQFVPHFISVEAGVVKAGGIAVGDLDGDDDIDVVTAGESGVIVYRNDGQNTFKRKVIGGEAAERVRLADLNSDERLDLLMLLPERNVVWYENRDDGSFTRTDFATESEAYATATDLSRETDAATLKRDWDGDGDEDVLTAAPDEVYWLENNGQDRFTRHTLLTDLESVGGVSVVDVNRDGADDIVAADTVRGALYWYEQTVTAALPSISPSPTPISVLHGNKPPVADAGKDITVQPDALVLLDGSGSSDPERDALTYEWRQLDGPATELLADRTSTPSFMASLADEAYIFMLTVKDSQGASAVDTVTVATRGRVALLLAARSPLETEVAAPTSLQVLLKQWLPWVNGGWLVVVLLLTVWLVGQRLRLRQRESRPGAASPITGGEGRVLHYQTGQPIAGAQIFIYDRDNKLKATERTNEQGAWPTLFPPGEYSLKVAAGGFEMAASAAAAVRPPGSGLLYAGGFFTVPAGSGPLTIVIPVRPLMAEAGSVTQWMSHASQRATRVTQLLSWPVIGVGVVLSTALVGWQPSLGVLIVEGLYIVVVAVRVAVGWQTRPAYGVVRDSITKAGLDLAVVRLFTADTNRLVMTRVTNSQGRFFALPPAGVYTVTVTKPGYSSFTKEKVSMGEGSGTTLQMTIDLMPLVPVV